MMKNPLQVVDRQAHLLDYHKQSLQHALRRFDNITLQVQRFELRSMNQVLEKIQKQTLYLNKYDEFIINNIKNRLQSETINLDKLDQNSIYKLKQAQQNIQYLKVTQSENHQRLIEETLANVQLKHKSLTDIMKVLRTLSPLAIMAKGYSLTYHEGSIIKSVDQVEINDTIKVRYQDGVLLAQVMGKESYDE